MNLEARNGSKTNKFADSGELARASSDFTNHLENPQSISEITHTFGAIYAHRPFKDYQRVAVSAGEASACCGVTILSAYANGKGSTMAIREKIETVVEVSGTLARAPMRSSISTGDPYLSACMEEAFDAAARPLPDYVSLQIFSPVASGKGMKTSSALGASLTAAACRALKVQASAAEIVEISSRAAMKAGVTQAGSVDDVWAAVRGGVVVTSATERKLLAEWQAPEDVEVVILIPSTPRPRIHSRDRRALMQPHKKSFDLFFSKLLSSSNPLAEMYAVMTEAAFITARAFDYPSKPLSLALRHGALGVSLSGKGPAMGALTESSATENVIEAWRQFSGRIIRTRPDNVGLRSAVRLPKSTTLKTASAF